MDKDSAQTLKGMWHHVEAECDNLIEKERAALETCKLDQVFIHQERIKIYRLLKNLPDDVLSR